MHGELNDLDDLDIFVQDGRLTARYRNWWQKREYMDIDFRMPFISAIDRAGAAQGKIESFSYLTEPEFELSGASQLDALNLPVEESELKLSGASNAKVWAYKFLDVDANGGNSVRYKGDPAIT